ncbi:M23 family metallopeptidase [Ferruginibacter lapsinanis]|uniref:M23 family metallopeptidase n=1 Tax=Ferruginibacter lapsinanis TaxID=563172 RepID=UPI001E29FE85|nr:M23 family metallopeptidase [Ferruginibacter lapsinanis]UEG50967.1 M23 family metallopeptidase [Ferruginibacter lapsinanis]
MKKIKYFYNTNTLRYEKLVTPLRVKLLRIFGFLSALLVSSALVIWLYTRFIPKPTDKVLQYRYDAMKDNYASLKEKTQTLERQIAELEKRDNEVYRSIFEANPVPDSARAKLIEKKKELDKVNVMNDDELSIDIANKLNNIGARIAYQRTSYDAIVKLIKNQGEKLSSIPAIQPISNKDLTRIASGFGFRIHPIYGIPKMHNGLDFTAPQGTPIYATGDGRVTTSGEGNGTGNHVVINHGYGYETVYMHMVRIKARAGQTVKRGEVIGWVGSTGASTGPHCHYEVHINGTPVDPVYFFYNDLNAEQYDRLLKLAATGSAKSFD